MRVLGGILLLILAHGLTTACSDGSRSSWPSVAPTPLPQAAPQPPAISMVLFTDRATGFSTTDVYDAQGQMVRFNTAGQLIWTVDDSRFDGYRVAGNYVGDRSLEVRFGGKSEERRAYLTFSLDYFHYDPPASVVDLEVTDGRLVISNANPPVPLPET